MVNKLAALITAIETVVLVRWLTLTRTVSRFTAAAFFFVGIAVEELIRFRGVKGRFPRGRELLGLAGGVAVEIVGWSLPLLFGLPFAQALIVLFVTLDLEHAIISTVTNGGRVIDKLIDVSDFSFVEAFGGAIWLVNPSPATLAIMIVTSFVEHIQGIRQGLGLRK